MPGRVKPKVSYLLSVYNGEKTLSSTLESLFNQKDIDLEIIAVNDGSADNSLKILKKYAASDRRLKIFQRFHLGLSLSRNFAVKKAKGDYLASASQDDIYLPDKSISQINYLKEKNLDFCFTQVEIIDEGGHIINHRSKKIYNAPLLPHPFTFFQVMFFWNVCSPTFLCKSYCYDKIKWHPSIFPFSDKNLWLKMLLEYKGGKLPQISLYRRLQPSAKQQNFSNIPLDFLYLEHRAAVLSALLYKFIPPGFILPLNNFLRVVKCFLEVEKDPADLSAYRNLAAVYRKLNYTLAVKNLEEIMEFLKT
ncbi:hypothetical protein A2W14_02235 [Candidatus Gottesmanbacteria bacterium RBG_16_37_8]|uniref:Glycosyltransferase 2-like domain-containing protein n=1 Tax=Candidatus Gottesmanbacteria bacterium RBG_16_37_8 TaxID=1798371 RepID=A0A1F5YRK9_9BACT|nr:MAG: hypothetical protein A2W14_02235 [Candidatus Gottesmanbacteria bacterium RBG_16_37_8]